MIRPSSVSSVRNEPSDHMREGDIGLGVMSSTESMNFVLLLLPMVPKYTLNECSHIYFRFKIKGSLNVQT